MKHIFATAATSLPGGAYAILLACLLGLYVLVGIIINNLFILNGGRSNDS